jgi:hypothetical protein
MRTNRFRIMKLLIVGVVFMCGSSWSVFGDQLFFDDFGSITGWSYPKGGLLASSGSYGYVGTWPSGNIIWAEKPITASLLPQQDFDFVLNFNAAENYGSCGLNASLIDDSGTMVAQMGWYNNTGSGGVGGLDFWGEGGDSGGGPHIFHSGMGYMNAGTLEIERQGTRWAAIVDGAEVAFLDLSSTLTATSVRIYAGVGPGYQAPDFQIDSLELTAVPEPAAWSLAALGIGALLGSRLLHRRST